MDARNMFPPTEFLGSDDLHGHPDVTMTISGIKIEKPPQGDADERSPIISFVEMEKRPKAKRKRWVLNKTNMRSIAKLYGFDTDSWIGKRITLYATTCDAWGEVVGCVRVRDRVASVKNSPPKSDGATPETDVVVAKSADPAGASIDDVVDPSPLSSDEQLALFAEIEVAIRESASKAAIDAALDRARVLDVPYIEALAVVAYEVGKQQAAT